MEGSMMNKWEKVLNIINEVQGTDIEMGEEFDIILADKTMSYKNPYMFTYDGMVTATNDGHFEPNSKIGYLISGEVRIKKLPRKPKEGEWYWVPEIYDTGMASSYTWQDCASDNAIFNLGIVRYTQEEAIALAKKMLEVAKGD
jgi:hypothetical protein